jgi:hypothetical protein
MTDMALLDDSYECEEAHGGEDHLKLWWENELTMAEKVTMLSVGAIVMLFAVLGVFDIVIRDLLDVWW